MDWFGTRISAELASHPSHYSRMCLARLKQWVWFDVTNPKSFVPAYQMSYLALATGSLLGLLAGPRRLVPLILVALALSSVHVFVITSARFRVCLELVMIPCCAGGILWIGALVSRFSLSRFADPLETLKRPG
jgi:hypothetical protein